MPLDISIVISHHAPQEPGQPEADNPSSNENPTIERLERQRDSLLAEADQNPLKNTQLLDREIQRLEDQIDMLRLAMQEASVGRPSSGEQIGTWPPDTQYYLDSDWREGQIVEEPSIEGEYEKVFSVEDLATARGVVGDWAQTKDGREWFVDGEWTLNCHVPCVNAKLQDIAFDIAWVMYRSEEGEEGNQSHGHPFWDFSASSVDVSEDETAATTTLTIEGTITGSGEIGTDGVTIKLVKHDSGHFTFLFQLDEGNAFATEAGGVVVESRGQEEDD